MSIEEFWDGLTSHNERNFSNFNKRNVEWKRFRPYISTNDQPSDQTIVRDNSHMLLKYMHEKWDKKSENIKRSLNINASEEATTKRQKL